MRTRGVLRDHLRQALDGEPGDDIAARFAEDCLVLTCFGTFQGRDGVRAAAALLEEQLPNARYRYEDPICQGELRFLGWSAEADGANIDDGADSFLIQDGTIRVMTIHYTCEPRSPG